MEIKFDPNNNDTYLKSNKVKLINEYQLKDLEKFID